MAFHESGTTTFIMCKLDQSLPPDLTSYLKNFELSSLEVVKDEPIIGWTGFNHFIDKPLSEENAQLGKYPYFHMVCLTRQIPSGLLKSHIRQQELEYMRSHRTRVVPREEKRRIKNETKEKLLTQVPPSLKGFPVLIDPTSQMVYFCGSTVKQLDLFLKLFYETLGRSLIPCFPENILEKEFGYSLGSLRPLQFSQHVNPNNEEIHVGRDFATWLWYFTTQNQNNISMGDLGNFTIEIDGPLTFAGEGPGAIEIVTRKGIPTRSPEAKIALLTGKKLKTLGLRIIQTFEEAALRWECTIDADLFIFRSMELPESDNYELEAYFQEKVYYLDIFRKVFLWLFQNFLKETQQSTSYLSLEEKLHQWSSSLPTTGKDVTFDISHN